MAGLNARCDFTRAARWPGIAALHAVADVHLPLPLQSFEAGSWVWFPDAKEMFLPGKVQKSFKPGAEGIVKTDDGKVR